MFQNPQAMIHGRFFQKPSQIIRSFFSGARNTECFLKSKKLCVFLCRGEGEVRNGGGVQRGLPVFADYRSNVFCFGPDAA